MIRAVVPVHLLSDDPLPNAGAIGTTPVLIVGAIAGGDPLTTHDRSPSEGRRLTGGR